MRYSQADSDFHTHGLENPHMKVLGQRGGVEDYPTLDDLGQLQVRKLVSGWLKLQQERVPGAVGL